MAGYICKIVIEDTHPPVWRRVLIPDRITFFEMHQIIQVLFGWEDAHLHDFTRPTDYICIGSEEDLWSNQYDEKKTLIDSFFETYKWIRYTYDFGNEWRHKINIEKIDMKYEERCAVLLKFKGDNFEEDMGYALGIDEDGRSAFKQESVEKQLKSMVFSKHEELPTQEIRKLNFTSQFMNEFMNQLPQMFKGFPGLDSEAMQHNRVEVVDDFFGEISPVKEKINLWIEFVEAEAWETLHGVLSEKSQKEILVGVGVKEIEDYYKYLRISSEQNVSYEEKAAAISECLRANPDYLCYVFEEEEYKALSQWGQCIQKTGVAKKLDDTTIVLKALKLGLLDFVKKENGWEISLPSDFHQYIGCVDTKTKKKIYKTLEKFDEGAEHFIQVYGFIELDSFYEMYKNLYEMNLEKEDFYRYIYWHCRVNDFVNTFYELKGERCYVGAKDINVGTVLEGITKYAQELPYAVYSKQELKEKGEDLANRTCWVEIFFTTLYMQLGIESLEAADYLTEIVVDIINGATLDEIIAYIEEDYGNNYTLEVTTELWTVLAGLMLELELPMLKGRSRLQYAKEQGCSPWSIGMLKEQEHSSNTSKRRMHQFPAEVQEWMYEANGYGIEPSIKALLAYKEKNAVCSEEYLYLLAETCIAYRELDKVEELLVQLKQSSFAGKKAAKQLEIQLQQCYEGEEYAEDINDWNWMDEKVIQLPYIRTEKKIGRNDPCPCGSGKKYKNCCGK